MLLVAFIGFWPHFADRPAIINAIAVNQAVCWQQWLWAHKNPSSVNSIGAAFQWPCCLHCYFR
jgi:hypothetical protein